MSKEFKIVQKSSPNRMSRQGHKPDLIVSHITEGNFDGAVTWLCNPDSGASSHFVVAKDGRITQLVDLKEAAWVNGTSVDLVKDPKRHYSKSTLQLVKERKTNANYYSIGIEHEGFYNYGQGKLTDAQLEATIWLHKHIIKEVKRLYGVDINIDREHVVGHYQVNPITKPNCPGPNFQWDKLIQALREDVIDMALEQWQKEMGEKALTNLVIKGVVNNPEDWKAKLGENVPQWLFWSMLDRLKEDK